MSVDASANTSAGRPRPVYLVVGATGKQGGAVINSLLDDDDDDATSTSASTGRTIRFLTRNEHSASSIKLQKRCCNAYKGDLLDKSSLQMALQGVDAAFLVTDPLKGVERETEQGITFIDAAKEAGVKHITFSSVCDADKATSVPHFQSKYKIEKHLQASGLSYTILRPVAFMDNFIAQAGVGRYMSIGLFYALCGWKGCQLIAVEDIGGVAARSLANCDDANFKNQIVDLSAGNYDYYSTIDAISKAEGGRQPWIAGWIPSQLVYLLPYDFKQMFLYFRTNGYSDVDMGKLHEIHPGLMSLQDWFAASNKSKTA